MAPSIRSSNSGDGVAVTTFDVPKPPTYLPGDWLVVFVRTWDSDYSGNNAVPSMATPWTQIAAASALSGTDGNLLRVFAKEASGDEGPFTVNFAASAEPSCRSYALKDCGGVDVVATSNASAYLLTRPIPAQTTRQDDELVMLFLTGYYTTTHDTTPTGWTQVEQTYGGLYTRTQPKAGAISTTWSSSASVYELMAAATISFRPRYYPQPQLWSSSLGI